MANVSKVISTLSKIGILFSRPIFGPVNLWGAHPKTNQGDCVETPLVQGIEFGHDFHSQMATIHVAHSLQEHYNG